jgi:hypothetical protein
MSCFSSASGSVLGGRRPAVHCRRAAGGAAQPQFTAESIFEIKDRAAFAVVRELGFANLSTGRPGEPGGAGQGRACRHRRRPLLRPRRRRPHVSRQEEFQGADGVDLRYFRLRHPRCFCREQGLLKPASPSGPRVRPAVGPRRPGPGADAQARPRSKLTAPARSGGEGGRGPPTRRRGCR